MNPLSIQEKSSLAVEKLSPLAEELANCVTQLSHGASLDALVALSRCNIQIAAVVEDLLNGVGSELLQQATISSSLAEKTIRQRNLLQGLGEEERALITQLTTREKTVLLALAKLSNIEQGEPEVDGYKVATLANSHVVNEIHTLNKLSRLEPCLVKQVGHTRGGRMTFLPTDTGRRIAAYLTAKEPDLRL